MNKRRTFIVMAILVAVLLLGVGYAAITNVNLVVNGTANVKADADFSVVFDNAGHTPVLSDSSSTVSINSTNYPVVAASYTSTTAATMTVYLDKDHTSEYAIFKIDNESTQLAATLTPSVTPIGSPNTTYFGTIGADLYTDASCTTPLTANLAAQGSAYLKVTVPKGSVEPAQDVTGASFTVTVLAEPAN